MLSTAQLLAEPHRPALLSPRTGCGITGGQAAMTSKGCKGRFGTTASSSFGAAVVPASDDSTIWTTVQMLLNRQNQATHTNICS